MEGAGSAVEGNSSENVRRPIAEISKWWVIDGTENTG
jgi:hypothetical protein